MEYNILPNMTISDTSQFITAMQNQSQQVITEEDLDKIKQYVSDNKDTVFYFGNDLVEKYSPEYADKAIIDTGILNQKSQHLFLSLLKEGSTEFRGYFVQTIHAFFKHGKSHFMGKESTFKQRYNSFSEKYRKIAEDKKDKILQFETIILKEEPDPYKKEEKPKDDNYYNKMNELTIPLKQLLNKNEWALDEGLDRHIKVIGDRIKIAIKENLTNYFVMNDLKDVIVNTGLMDKFGNYILIMYRMNHTYDNYRPYIIIDSKQDYIDNGFTKIQASIPLVPIPNIIAEEIRNGISSDFDDYDLSFNSLKHIIIDRIERFPSQCSILSERDIAEKIRTALKDGVEKLKMDGGYAKPIYSTDTHEICWVFPLKIFAKANQEPELVLVVRKDREFYSLKTVLPYDEEIKDRIRSAKLYQSEW